MILGQVHGYTRICLIAVFEITVETDGKVKARDDEHARIKDASKSAEVAGRTHIVVQRQDLRHSFEREDDRAVEKKHCRWRFKHWPLVDGRQILRDVNKQDDEAGGFDEAGHVGERVNVPVIPDAAQDKCYRAEHQYPVSHIPSQFFKVVVH